MAGLLLVGAAGLTAWQTSRFIAPAASAPGTVTRLNAGGSHPQITFGKPDGTLVSYQQGGMIGGYTVGQNVHVLFDPARPRTTARVSSFSSTLMLLGIDPERFAWQVASPIFSLLVGQAEPKAILLTRGLNAGVQAGAGITGTIGYLA